MILLDTTVLAYAAGDAHPLKPPCRSLIDAQGAGVIEAATTVEVLQEFVHVRSQRRERTDAVVRARQYAALFSLLVTQPGDLERGLDLYERHPRLGAFDSVLAGVALNQGATALVSADRAFEPVTDLNWIDPATSALDELLAAGPDAR